MSRLSNLRMEAAKKYELLDCAGKTPTVQEIGGLHLVFRDVGEIEKLC